MLRRSGTRLAMLALHGAVAEGVAADGGTESLNPSPSSGESRANLSSAQKAR
jgi:hypothetical protein